MQVSNKLATGIIMIAIIVLAFLVIFVTKIIISAEPKQQEINKNIENQLDNILGDYTGNSNVQTNEDRINTFDN